MLKGILAKNSEEIFGEIPEGVPEPHWELQMKLLEESLTNLSNVSW